jgi:GNAT superfamily N-acetyltransferase
VSDGGAVIAAAAGAVDYAAFGALAAEYSAWLSHKHAGDAWFIEAVLKHQSLDAELAGLPSMYGPPDGFALLAMVGGAVAGGVGCRRLSAEACEMKRMFVRGEFRGRGIGRALSLAVINGARARGFRLMQLDTSRHHLAEAITLYRSLGFRDCPPYRAYPPELLANLLFLELPLTAAPPAAV